MPRIVRKPTEIIVPYGHPNVDSVYVKNTSGDEKEFDSWESFVVIKKLNQMSSFEIRFAGIEADDRTWIVDGSEVKIVNESNLILKGRIESVEYESDFYTKVKGFGMEAKLLDYEVDRKEYDTTATNTIVSQLCSVNTDAATPWIITVGTNTNWGNISFRGEYDNKLRFLANLANTIDYDWWVDHTTTTTYLDTDRFNIDTARGSASSVKTFATGGSGQNCTVAKKEEELENVVNYITVLGYGDGVNQIKTSFYNASATTTTLNETLTSTDTTITLTDASSFDSSGTIRIAEEQITYTGKTGNNLTGCTRGASSTTAKAHPNGVFVEEHIDVPTTGEEWDDVAETGSSIKDNGIKEKRMADQGLIDDSAAQLLASKMLTNYKDPIVRITLLIDDVRFSEADIGDTVTVDDDDTGLSTTYRIMASERSNTMERGEELRIECSNAKLTFIDEMGDIRKKTDTITTYAQGATVTDNIGEHENLDATTDLDMRFYLPADIIRINKALLSFKFKEFRAYTSSSQTAAAGGAQTSAANSAFAQANVNVASSATVVSNLVDNTWTDATIDYSPGTDCQEEYAVVGAALLDAGSLTVPTNFFVRIYDGTSYFPSSSGIYMGPFDEADAVNNELSCVWINIPENVNGKTLEVQIKQDSADNVDDVDFSVWVTYSGVATHTHDVVDHTHSLTMSFGIQEDTQTSKSVDVTAGVDGSETTVATYTTDQTSVDLATQIKDAYTTNGAGWYNVKFDGNKNMRIEANLFLKYFIESK